METNAELFAAIKRNEIMDTIDSLPNTSLFIKPDVMRECYSGPKGIGSATFWQDFTLNYAERLLGAEA